MEKFSLSAIIDKLFRKTILLKAKSDGTFEAIDITGESNDALLKKEGITVELKPTNIYKVVGLKRIANICIQEYNGTQLVSLFGKEQEPMTETTLMNMLENAENAGRLQAEGGGADQEKMRKQMSMMLILAVVSAIGVVTLIYMKLRGM